MLKFNLIVYLLFIIYLINFSYAYKIIIDKKSSQNYENYECGGSINLNDLKEYPPCKNFNDAGNRARQIINNNSSITFYVLYYSDNFQFTDDRIGDLYYFSNIELLVVNSFFEILDNQIKLNFFSQEPPFLNLIQNTISISQSNIYIKGFAVLGIFNGFSFIQFNDRVENYQILYEDCNFYSFVNPTFNNDIGYEKNNSIIFKNCYFSGIASKYDIYFNQILFDNCEFYSSVEGFKINNCKSFNISGGQFNLKNFYYFSSEFFKFINIENIFILNYDIATCVFKSFISINNTNEIYENLNILISNITFSTTEIITGFINITTENYKNKLITFKDFTLSRIKDYKSDSTEISGLITSIKNVNQINFINVQIYDTILSYIAETDNSNILLQDSNLLTFNYSINGHYNNISSVNSTYNNEIILDEPFCNILNNMKKCNISSDSKSSDGIKNQSNSGESIEYSSNSISSSLDSNFNNTNNTQNNKENNILIKIIIPVTLFIVLIMMISIIFIIIYIKKRNEIKRNLEKQNNKNKIINEINYEDEGSTDFTIIDLNSYSNDQNTNTTTIYSNFLNDSGENK